MRRGAGTGNSPEKVPIQSGFGVVCRLRRYSFARRRASAPCFHLEIRAAPDSDPGTLFLVGDHNGIAGRIQSRAQIWRHRGLAEITGNLTTHSGGRAGLSVWCRRHYPHIGHPHAGVRGDGQRAAGAGTGRRHQRRVLRGVDKISGPRRGDGPRAAGAETGRRYRAARCGQRDKTVFLLVASRM